LIHLLERAAGRIPTMLEQEYMAEWPEWQRALDGNRAALVEVKRRFADAARGERPDESRPRRAHAVGSVTSAASRSTARRAAVLAKHHARQAAAGFWREYMPTAATFQTGRAGSDDLGRWCEVRVGVRDGRTPFPLTTVRLRLEPVAAELSTAEPAAPRAPRGSALEFLIGVARELGLTYGWSEFQSMRFLLAGTVPKPSPLVVRTRRALDEYDNPIAGSERVIIVAAMQVPAPEVAAAFTEAAKRGGRPESSDTMARVLFVDRVTAENGGKRPPWTKVAASLKAEHPDLKCDYRDLRKTYLRAVERR
jgi:hypothetical protein